MSSYYAASNNQQETAPMLYLRDNFPGSYSEAPVLSSNMMLYMNSGPYSLATNSQQQNNGIQIPSVGASDSTPQQQEILSGLGASQIGDHELNEWRDGRNTSVIHSIGAPTNVLHGGQSFQGQGLSLTLGTQIPSRIQVNSVECQNANPCYTSFLSPNPTTVFENGSRSGFLRDHQSRNIEYFHSSLSGGNADSSKEGLPAYGVAGVPKTITNSKYLNAAQQLLEEVVNVCKAFKTPSEKNLKADDGKKGSMEVGGESEKGNDRGCSNQQDSSNNSVRELSQAERQDLQNKLTKLLQMYDEVERRYKQYYHHMQIVVSSFDVIAGCGAAKPYTALALQTISRHFRCLRDAIDGQIQATRRSLGEQDVSGNGKGIKITRLRYVDQQLRQQRALQQLGISQHTWRPQRGLPESSVSILRAWLFEHFLHPYPKDSDKIMLARQTGLTRSQVSNWFINARVRLWKPMVEEMYKEETGDADIDSNSSTDNTAKATKGDDNRGEDQQPSAKSGAAERVRQSLDPRSAHIADVEMAGPTEGSGTSNDTNRGSETDCGLLKPGDTQRPNNVDGYTHPSDSVVQPDGGGNGFMSASTVYQMSNFGRSGGGNGVSLTLGLQHCEAGSLPESSGNQNDYMSSRGHVFYNTAAGGGSSVPVETSDFECISAGNRQARFGSTHLLHDFVA